jgi:hypothetical protein
MKRYVARGDAGIRRPGSVGEPKRVPRHQAEVSPILGNRESQALRSVCRLTIVGGVREALLVWRLGRWEHCAPEAPCRPL